MQFIQQFPPETPETAIYSETPETFPPGVFRNWLFMMLYNCLTEQRLKIPACVLPYLANRGKLHQCCPESGSPLQAQQQVTLLQS